MSETPTPCPKCSGRMVQGIVYESEGPKRMVSTWVEVAPEAFLGRGAKTSGKKRLPMPSSAVRSADFWSRTRDRNLQPNDLRKRQRVALMNDAKPTKEGCKRYPALGQEAGYYLYPDGDHIACTCSLTCSEEM